MDEDEDEKEDEGEDEGEDEEDDVLGECRYLFRFGILVNV